MNELTSSSKESDIKAGWGMAMGMMHGPNVERPAAVLEVVENEKPQDLSLGELNPLIHPIEFGNRPAIDSLIKVTKDLIRDHGGVLPVKLGTEVVTSNDEKKAEQRFIAKFVIEDFTEEKMVQLETLVEAAYSRIGAVRTRRSPDGTEIEPESYVSSDRHQMRSSRTSGWYMGSGPTPTDALHPGLFVFRDYGKMSKDNFFSENSTPTRFIVEVREAKDYQTDIVALITQVSSILGTGKTLDHGDLIYDAYYRLMRIGLKDFDPNSIYGMADALDQIRRGLIYPLASPELSKGIDQEPTSVLLAGVPGTGKTLIAEQLLYEDTGLLLVPMTPLDLFRELTKDPKDQDLFKRISSVARSTGRKVVLQVDDIENITEDGEKTKSSLLNSLAGVYEHDFKIIASTNEPERIGESLLQPQRFGIVIHCGLQTEEARRHILGIHATQRSARENLPLFETDEERDIILQEVARYTDGFTPRYLAEVATVAKSYLLARVAAERGKFVGLTEKDLGDHKFTIEDWERAIRDVLGKYDKKKTQRRDEEIRKFVIHANDTLGFRIKSGERGIVFDSKARERIAALRIRNQKSSDSD